MTILIYLATKLLEPRGNFLASFVKIQHLNQKSIKSKEHLPGVRV